MKVIPWRFAVLTIGFVVALYGVALYTMKAARLAATQRGTAVVEHQDPELTNAIKTAQMGLQKSFVPRLQHPLPGDQGFAICARFETPYGSEFLWVNNLTYDDKGKFTGNLAQEPKLLKMHKGDTVTVPMAQVVDWEIGLNDGTVQGNFTAFYFRQKRLEGSTLRYPSSQRTPALRYG